MSIKRNLMTAVLILMLCTPLAWAVENKPYNLTPYLGYHFFDGKRDFNDRPEFGILMERTLKKDIGIEAGIGGIFTSKSSNDDSTFGLTYRFNANYYIGQLGSLDKKFMPYLTGGIGGDYIDNEALLGLNGGIGIKYLISKEVALRAEARRVFTFKGKDDYIVMLGLSFPLWFGGKPAPIDADGDGVADELDKCPGTPRGVKVDKDGCPIDSDGDGVPDYQDNCPRTPKGAKVDKAGCVISITLKVNFDTNKSVVKDEFLSEIEQFANFMKDNPNINVEIQGHTDNLGNANANLILSDERANAVMSVLVNKFNVPQKRLSAKGYGMTKPVESNDTAEGRAKNRRVEAVVVR